MQRKETTKDAAQSDDDKLPKVYFSNEATNIQTDFLYRGTSQAPDSAFPEGMKSKGGNLNLWSHLDPFGESNPNWVQDSGYISTSKKKMEAAKFPAALEPGETAYL